MIELQRLVDVLAIEIGRPLTVDDRRFRVLAYSAHQKDADPVRLASIVQREPPSEVAAWLNTLDLRGSERYIRVGANKELGMAGRVCIPLRFDGMLLGYVWLIDAPDPLAESELEAAVRSAEDLGVALYKAQHLEHTDRERERRLVEELLASPPERSREAAEELTQGGFLATARVYGIVLVRPHGMDRRPAPEVVSVRCVAAMEQLRRSLSPRHMLVTQRRDCVIGVAAADRGAGLEKAAAAVLRSTEESLEDWPEWSAMVAVGGLCDAVEELPRAYREAQHAAHLGKCVPGLESPVLWSRLGAYRTIAPLAANADPADPLPATLSRLLACHGGRSLAETLECYLDRAGDARAAATAMFLHRSTLYQRLRRIEEIAGVDLGMGDDRLELHLGLRLWRIHGSPEADSA